MNKILQNRTICLALLVLLFWFSWSFAISRTVEIRGETQDLKKTKNSQDELVVKKAQLLRSIGKEYSRNESIDILEQNTLGLIKDFCSDKTCQVIKTDPVHEYQSLNATARTWVIQVEGGFHDLIRLQHELEKGQSSFQLINAEYEKKERTYRQKEKLQVTFCLQNIHVDA